MNIFSLFNPKVKKVTLEEVKALLEAGSLSLTEILDGLNYKASSLIETVEKDLTDATDQEVRAKEAYEAAFAEIEAKQNKALAIVTASRQRAFRNKEKAFKIGRMIIKFS